MAHAGKFKKTQKYFYDFVFDGTLQSTVRGGLINELIKYILYERQQIPLPFEQIKRDLKPLLNSTETGVTSTQHQSPDQARQSTTKGKCSNRLELKRAIKAITNLEQIFIQILHVFEMCPEINQVLFVLGGTVISPKESYLINLEPVHPEADTVSLKSCTKQLFRQLIMNDMLGNAKSISHTNLTVLVNAPRDCGITWFLPKPNFRISSRGKQFIFNFSSKHLSATSNQSLIDNDFELSGIEPLESSDIDMLVGDHLKSISISEENSLEESLDNTVASTGTVFHGLQNSRETTVKHSPCVFQESFKEDVRSVTEDNNHFLWYQAPVVITGYKDRTFKKANWIS